MFVRQSYIRGIWIFFADLKRYFWFLYFAMSFKSRRFPLQGCNFLEKEYYFPMKEAVN